MPDSQSSQVYVGSHGEYEWLTTEHTLEDLLRLSPEIVLKKHVAVTACDSGYYALGDEEKAAGWESRGRIAYSPRIDSIDVLPRDVYDEWYVFESLHDLGELVSQEKNVFETPITRGQILALVNFGFALHLARFRAINDLFWSQLELVQPESYISDGEYLNVVSSNKDLFALVRKALTDVCDQ